MPAPEDELERLERLRQKAMLEELQKRAHVRPPGDDYTHLRRTSGASFSVTKILVATLAIVAAVAALSVASKKLGLDRDKPGSGRVR